MGRTQIDLEIGRRMGMCGYDGLLEFEEALEFGVLCEAGGQTGVLDVVLWTGSAVDVVEGIVITDGFFV